MAIARDKFWMFGVKAHQDDMWLKPSGEEKVDYYFRSRITPAEGAMILDIPNMMMVNCDGVPAPYSKDALGYAESFYRMKQVMWSGTGSSGFRAGNEEEFICSLADKYPNIMGEYLDDLHLRFRDLPDGKERAVALLKEIREKLDKASHPIKLHLGWYWHHDPYPGMMEYVDYFSFWTWHSEQLPMLKERFEIIEPKFRGKKILLGIYMYDFPGRHPVPLDLMEYQCNYALELLKEGRIDGIIFEANSVMGVGLPSEKWLREWIDQVKNTVVPD